MSNQRNPVLVLPAIGSLLFSVSSYAAVTVINGQLVDSRNQVVSLQIAAEPLVVPALYTDQDQLAAAAVFQGTVAADIPTPLKIQPNGKVVVKGKEVDTLTVDLTSPGFYVTANHGNYADFDVRMNNSVLTVKAIKGKNNTGRQLQDQIHINGAGIGNLKSRLHFYQAISLSQNSGPTVKFANVTLDEARAAGSIVPDQGDPPSSELYFDTALRKRAENGSNAVLVIVSSSDVGTRAQGTTLSRLLQACQRQNLWCLIEVAAADPNAPAASMARSVEYFTSPDVQDELREHPDQAMLLLRESDGVAFDARAALTKLRTAGLPNVLLFSRASIESSASPAFDATTLLGLDPYQSLAFAVATETFASVAGSAVVPVFAMPAAVIAPAVSPNTFVMSRRGEDILVVPEGVTFPPDIPSAFEIFIGGNMTIQKATSSNTDIFTVAGMSANTVTVKVLKWQVPPNTKNARLAKLTIQAKPTNSAGMVVWGWIDIKQLHTSANRGGS